MELVKLMLHFLWRVRGVVTVKRNILRTGSGYRTFNLLK